MFTLYGYMQEESTSESALFVLVSRTTSRPRVRNISAYIHTYFRAFPGTFIVASEHEITSPPPSSLNYIYNKRHQ